MKERSTCSSRRVSSVAAVGAVCALTVLWPPMAEAQGRTLGSGQVVTDRIVETLPPPVAGGCGTTASAASVVMMRRPGRGVGGEGPGSELPPGEPPQQRSLQFAVLLQEGARDSVVARRLTRAAFERRHDQLAAQGHHLADFEIVAEGSEPCFSGLWYAGSVAQRLDLGSPQQLFVEAHDAAASGGLLPADVETYLHQGQRLFAGVWSSNATGNLIIVDVDRAQIETTVQGVRRLVDLESWPTAGGRRYMAIHKPSSVQVQVFFGQEFTDFGEESKRLIDYGFQPVELEIEEENGEPRYSSVWEQAGGGFWLFVGLAEPLQDCRLVSLGLESSEFTPLDANRCLALAAPRYPGLPHLEPGEVAERARAARPGAAAGAELERRVAPGRMPATTFGAGIGLEQVPFGIPALHIIDFVVTRRELSNPSFAPGSIPNHRGVLHDSGASGPGI